MKRITDQDLVVQYSGPFEQKPTETIIGGATQMRVFLRTHFDTGAPEYKLLHRGKEFSTREFNRRLKAVKS